MKKQLRQQMLKIRDNLAQKEEKSARITDALINSELYRSAHTIMVYMSFGSEVDTRGLTEKMLSDGKSLCAPVCVDKHTMIARSFSSQKELRVGAYGISEPVGEEVKDIDLILVPGVAFNRELHRIGYGAGYYDRFLEKRSSVTCGLFYEAQKAEFSADSHDRELDFIITETKIYKKR